MKVSPRTWSVSNPEQLYRQVETKFNHQAASEKQAPVARIEESNPPQPQKISTKDILSSREIETLKLLFGYEQNETASVYGKSQIKGVHSGYLLDVKG